MKDIIVNFLLQIFYSVGIVALFGLAINYINKLIVKLFGRHAYKIDIVTGVIGTPIHEIGHAIMCVIFGHKIVDMQLYKPDKHSGTLGYVNHSYNKRSIYHRIGNFFIGVGPILLGSVVLILLMRLMLPITFTQLSSVTQLISDMSFNLFSIETYKTFWSIFSNTVTVLFNFNNLGNIWWWLYLIIGLSIGLHMRLSKADIKGSLLGFGTICLILFVIDIILFFIGGDLLTSLTSTLIFCSSFIVNFLLISILMSLLILVIAALYAIIKKGMRRF